MAFQPVNFAGINPLGYSGVRNLPQSLAQGFQAAQLPVQARQKAQSELMSNLLKQAQIQKALQPPKPERTNLEKALMGITRVQQQYGADSPQAKMAEQYAKRLAEGTGTSLTVDPSTGAVSFQQGGRQSGGGAQIVDGKLVQRPTTGALTDIQKKQVANKTREVMSKHFNQPYVGTGSNIKLAYDRFLYNTTNDPNLKKQIGERLVNAAVAQRLVPEYALMQLNAQGGRATVPAIDHQTEALTQGWAEGLPLIAANLPKELQNEVKKRHDLAIDDLSKAQSLFTAMGLPINLPKKEDKNKKPTIQQRKSIGGTNYVKINGEWYEE